MSTDEDGPEVIVVRPKRYQAFIVLMLLQAIYCLWLFVTTDVVFRYGLLLLVLATLLLVWSIPRRHTVFDSWGVRWRSDWFARPLPWTKVVELTPERIQPAYLEARLRSGRCKNLSPWPTAEQLQVIKTWHTQAQGPEP